VTDVYAAAGAGACAFFVNLIITPILVKLSHYNEWYDKVDHRKIHDRDIPRIGGVGIFLASMAAFGLMLYLLPRLGIEVEPPKPFWYVLPAGMILIHVIGLLDDFANLKPRFKLFGQIIASLAVVSLGYSFEHLYLPFYHQSIPLGAAGPVVTFIWIIGVSNAVNLIDGLDGLSGTLCTVAFAFMGLYALHSGNIFVAVLALSAFGAVIAFLLFNFPPARIFMGDSGSLLLGFLLAVAPLLPSAGETSGTALPFTVSIVLIPVYDTIGAVIRRWRKGQRFYIPDKEHLHHKLLELGFSNRAILLALFLVSLAVSATAFAWILLETAWLGVLLLALWIICAAVFILVERHSELRGAHVKNGA
jgi:UDP-GlcNAc:undecaprenyl-phosphate GlcNAc-1-phosphate transferase